MTGYRDPPKHSQYPPGVSGNPNGRPKGRTIFADIAEELQQQIELSEGTSSRTVSKQRLVVMKLVEAAIGGDLRAIATVLNMCPRKPEYPLTVSEDQDHREILDAYSNRGTRRNETQSPTKTKE